MERIKKSVAITLGRVIGAIVIRIACIVLFPFIVVYVVIASAIAINKAVVVATKKASDKED